METIEEATGPPEPKSESGSESASRPASKTMSMRVGRFVPRTFLAPVRLLKKKVGAFVRKLSGISARNRSGNESTRNASKSASVQSVTPVKVREEAVSEIDGVSESDGAPGVLSLSPISDVHYTTEGDLVQDKGIIQDANLLDQENSVTVVDSVHAELRSDIEDAEYSDRIDKGPRRVRSKLPSEEEQPYVELGMVSMAIEKLNLANSGEVRQAPSFLKTTSLLPLPTTAAHALTEIKSSTDIDVSGSPQILSNLFSMTQSSVASEAKELSRQSESVDVSSTGRVERLRRLFEE